MIAPHCQVTSAAVGEQEVVLCVGDTTFLDYGRIVVKRDDYGPTGNGGNGLILHSALAVDVQHGQPIGLLSQKLWNREVTTEPPADETVEQKQQRRAKARSRARKRPFQEKESYRWVEAMEVVEVQVQPSTRVIHVFDREGDIAEVFERVRRCQHSGVVVRSAHDRSLDATSERLWATMQAQPIAFEQSLEIPQSGKRAARTARLAVRFAAVNLRTPYRFDLRHPFPVYAVYVVEVDCPEGETPLNWMLLTTEAVTTVEMAMTILRWYSYRWRVEEYHKLLKSGTQAERYRLAGDGMKVLLGFLSVIAVELLRLTYLHRSQPDADAQLVLNPIQMAVLKAKAKTVPQRLTVAWALAAVARLGGYLEHRRHTPIGIQVLWRGWLTLQDLCQGWQLASRTESGGDSGFL